MKLIKVLRFDESCKFIVFLTDDDRYVFIDLADEKFTVDPESVFYLRYGIWNMKAPQYMIDKAHEIFNSGKGRYIKENPWTKGNLYEKKMLNAYKYHLIPKSFKRNHPDIEKTLPEWGYTNFKFVKDLI